MNQKAPKVDGMGDGLADMFRASMEPKGLPSLRGDIRKQGDDEEIEERAAQIAQRHGGFTQAKAPRNTDPIERISVALAKSTRLQLKKKAALKGVTITHLINQALKDAGYPVPEEALVTDGRKRR